MICIDKCDYINANGRTFAIGLRNIVELVDIRLKNTGSNTQLLNWVTEYPFKECGFEHVTLERYFNKETTYQ